MLGELAPKINNNILFPRTYIPTIGDGTNNFTTSTALGFYSQVGNKISFQSSVVWTSIGSSSGQLRYLLPFTIGPSVFRISCSISGVSGISITGSYLVVNGSSGSNFVTFQGISSSGTGTTVNCSSCSASGSINVGGDFWIN